MTSIVPYIFRILGAPILFSPPVCIIRLWVLMREQGANDTFPCNSTNPGKLSLTLYCMDYTVRPETGIFVLTI